VWFSGDNFVLTAAQAGCVALPAAGLPAWAERLRGRAWALSLPLSIGLVVTAIAVVPWTAYVLTWAALVLVPLGCALALGWAAGGARPWACALAVPLLAIAWAVPGDRAGQAAATVMIAASAVTLGRLLVGAAPSRLLTAGAVAMVVLDAVLVFSGNLEAANAVLVAASPASHLPQLQSASFGPAVIGYGDLFVAAVVGAMLAAERRLQLVGAAVTLVLSMAWDQLLSLYSLLPATIPPVVALIAIQSWRRRDRRTPRAA
jgi:hypothetical protein